MADQPKKKARWSLLERAAHLEDAKGYQRSRGKQLDTRQQTSGKPDSKARRMARRASQ
jgi:hypothetical protein